MRKTVNTILLAGLLLSAGCGGGSNVGGPNATPGTAEYKAALDTARMERLAAAPLATVAAVSGQLTLTGLQVLDPAGAPAPATASYSNILARIINPEDDILSIVEGAPDSSGRFNLQVPSPPRRAVLEVSFKVEADLDGDGTGGDTVRQRIPLTLALGRTATADLSLRQQDGYQPGAPAPVGEELPTVVTAQASVLDAAGRRSFGSASNFRDGEVLADADGNNSFDPRADLTLADANADGLADTSYPLYTSALPFDTIFGTVSRIDQFQRTAEVIVKSGKTGYIVNVKLDPQAALELYLPNTPAGESFAELKPDQFLLGRSVYIDGFYTDGAAQRALTALSVTALQ